MANIQAMSRTDLLLYVGITSAENDTREAPWYGSWDIVLQSCIFGPLFCKAPWVTITHPQYPVSRHIDTYDSDEDQVGYDEGGDNDRVEDDGVGSTSVSKSPFNPSLSPISTPYNPPFLTTPPNRTASIRYSAPSPESFRGSPQNRNTSFGKKHSTRIPDFVQLLYKIKVNQDGTLEEKFQYFKRTILLVEIKKSLKRPEPEDFPRRVLRQTDQQARYAFADSPNSHMIGVIVAIGPYWTYGEYDRNHIRASPSMSEQKDATYMDESPPPNQTWMQAYQPFDLLADSDGFLRLQTPSSNQGLRLVRDRLKELWNL